MSYKSIKTVPAVSRQGGTQQRIFLCPFADLTTIVDHDATYKIATAHTPAVGKGFVEIYVTKDTGEVTFEPIGGADRHSYMAKGSFYHPGEGDDIVALTNQLLLDCRHIVLCTLPGSSELIQVGGNDFQVELKPKYATTKNSGDGRGFEVEFECFMPAFVKYTAATIPMTSVV